MSQPESTVMTQTGTKAASRSKNHPEQTQRVIPEHPSMPSTIKDTHGDSKSFDVVRKEKSEAAKKTFQQMGYFEGKFPTNLQFIPSEFDDEVAAVYGYDDKSGLGLTAVAAPGQISKEQVVPYIKQNMQWIENTKENPIKQIGQPQTLPPPPEGSGITAGTMWSGTLANGDDVHVVMLDRADKKGSYFFMYSGPKENFYDNEGYFDELYQNFKALPAPQDKSK
ncbi:MAG: hypothetical protein KDD33_02815 [Bdellovibrionales bacterium]|nr:hypothetical protein [Bdellovibrionales bacterium]